MMERKTEYRALALSALLAAVFLLFFSRSSPLYPTNNWGEANAFFTVGRAMLAGKVPYRDLALSAGPVVYLIHALAACISDTGFLGVWVMEIIAVTGLLFFAWRAAARISGMPALSMGMSALMALLLVSGRAFLYGDTVEEFALPLQMWALCDLLAYLGDPERRMSSARLAMHGFMAGCVFWLKYTLTGVHLAFIAVMCIDDMIRQRELKGAICMCLEYASGAVLATVPHLAYFGVNGALGNLLRGYLGGEWMRILESITPVRDALAGLVSGAIYNPAAALMLLCGAGFLLRRLVHGRWNTACTAVVAAFACAALMMYFKDDRHRFSFLCVGAFVMLCAGPLALLAKYARRQRRACAALLACALALCLIYSCFVNESLPRIGCPDEELPQNIFAEYIEENGGGEVLTYNIADHGFYLALDQLPQERAFANSRSYYSTPMDSAWKLADRGAAPWIISRSKHKPGGMYMQVKSASSPYDCNITSGKPHTYYLYRLIEK